MRHIGLLVLGLALALLLAPACSSDDGDGDDDDGTGDTDTDGDGDTDTDSDADADGDSDTDADGDTDTGSDQGCEGYPIGPYDWDEGKVVTNVEFPAIYGSGGEETVLNMCDVFNNQDEVKSLVFAIGSFS